MRTTFFLSALFALLSAVSRVAAQTEPTPEATPAPVAQPVQPAKSEAACPMCGMAMADCKDEKVVKLTESNEAVFAKIEQDWGDAVVRHDADFLERLESDDYTYTGPDGGVAHKADDIAGAKAGTVRIDSFAHHDLKVRVYGETAVVTGETVLKGTAGDTDLGGHFRWTDVFVKHGGRWQAVASQATAVGKPAVED